MTKEQLVHGLRYCSAVGMCDDCALSTIQKEFGAQFCDDRLKSDAADLIVAQAAEIEKLKAQVPRWIPVEERLPESDEDVLLIVNGKVDNVTLIDAYELGSFSKSEGWILEMWPEWEDPKVTHWMPLPEVET